MAWLEKRNRRYFIAWREGDKRLRTGGDEGGWADKQVARQKLAEWERARARGEAGLVDPFKDHRKRSLAEHVVDYVADLEAKGLDDIYVYNCEKLLIRLFTECNWKLLGDITADSFCAWRGAIPKHARPVEGSAEDWAAQPESIPLRCSNVLQMGCEAGSNGEQPAAVR